MPLDLLSLPALVTEDHHFHSIGKQRVIFVHVDNVEPDSALNLRPDREVEPVCVPFSVDIVLQHQVVGSWVLRLPCPSFYLPEGSKQVSGLKPALELDLTWRITDQIVFSFTFQISMIVFSLFLCI